MNQAIGKILFYPAALLLLLLITACQPTETTITAGRMGEVAYLTPEHEPSNVIFLISDTSGWNADLEQVAKVWRTQGAVVLKVSLPNYLAALRHSDDGCHYLISEIEDTSHRLQARLGTEHYHAPILVGTGMAATLVYAALAQSPAATIAGAAGDGTPSRLDTKVPLCPGAVSAPATDGGFSYAPRLDLNGWWRLLPPVDQRESAQAFISDMTGAELVTMPEGASLAERLNRLLRPAFSTSAAGSSTLANLPLVELPVKNEGNVMAVIWSGDGGWRDLDKTIGERLHSQGIPVVGVDSLRYFWSQKTPEQVAADLEVILRHYQKAWGRPQVILIGYSFGANIMPFVINRLPEDLQASIVRISLLGLSQNAVFGIHIGTRLFGFASKDKLPVLPEAAQLDLQKVQCFYGADEEDTACTASVFDRAERIKTRGGHHFDGNYQALAQRILHNAQ